MSFHNNFFGSLPVFFKLRDSYKDTNDQGILERFLSIFEIESEEVKNVISETPILLDPEDCPEDYLTFLASVRGNPPASFRDNQSFIKIVQYTPWVVYGRGTLKTVSDFFSLLGLGITLENIEKEKISYDLANHDQSNLYDTSITYCRYYKANILDPNNLVPALGEEPVPLWAISNLIRVFEYLLPINIFISEITYNDTTILDPLIIIRKYSNMDTDIRISANSVIRII